MLEKAAGAVRNLSDVIDNAEEMADRLDSYRYEIIDISERVSDILSGEDVTDPERKLDIVESRLNQIKKLKMKYGETLGDVILKREEIKTPKKRRSLRALRQVPVAIRCPKPY